jgi:hypothetical protein
MVPTMGATPARSDAWSGYSVTVTRAIDATPRSRRMRARSASTRAAVCATVAASMGVWRNAKFADACVSKAGGGGVLTGVGPSGGLPPPQADARPASNTASARRGKSIPTAS